VGRLWIEGRLGGAEESRAIVGPLPVQEQVANAAGTVNAGGGNIKVTVRTQKKRDTHPCLWSGHQCARQQLCWCSRQYWRHCDCSGVPM